MVSVIKYFGGICFPKGNTILLNFQFLIKSPIKLKLLKTEVRYGWAYVRKSAPM